MVETEIDFSAEEAELHAFEAEHRRLSADLAALQEPELEGADREAIFISKTWELQDLEDRLEGLADKYAHESHHASERRPSVDVQLWPHMTVPVQARYYFELWKKDIRGSEESRCCVLRRGGERQGRTMRAKDM